MLAYRQPELMALVLALALGAPAAACYSPSILDCSIECGIGGACPDGTRCGEDGLCHTGDLNTCGSPGTDGGLGMPDAPPIADAPRRIDAPGTPDASPPPPDAGMCPGSTVGEPDNLCPGENTGAIPEGTTHTIDDHVIAPAKDIDIFQVPILLQPIQHCPSNGVQTYALRVNLSTGSASGNLALRRFTSDRLCDGTGTRSGISICIPYTVACNTPPQQPTFFFAVSGGNDSAAVCTPYTLALVACQAGSTCDNCKASGPN